tara:strand:- start:635 stop:826 length:192 start_codon:yes stop_codon:yes gene_type:complete
MAILQPFRLAYGVRCEMARPGIPDIPTNGGALAWMTEKIFSWRHAIMSAIGQTQAPPVGEPLL